ncbi:MAG: serine/threonine protein kinase, partial [Lachnospiraceae bacterium]|nr:serine/threonine protein kinase [Lachnospiraceae bacterium]
MITVNNRKLCENCFKDITSEICPYCGFSKASFRQDPMTLAIGSVLNQRYMTGRVIGKGGFGITYLAYDLKLDTRIAVKEYYPMGMAIRNPGSTLVSVSNAESEESFRSGAEKFYNEAKMVAKFNGNPNIVSVHDFFYENDTVYFTMGYLEGETLKSYLKAKEKLTEGQAVKVLQDISSALMASHSMNILHRDVSPDNIMLCDDGSIKLLDFGAARQVVAEQSQGLSVILKQGFAPLEQYQKKGRQGPWTDIYALGATVYHALTGNNIDDPMTRLEDDSGFESNKYGITDELWSIIHKSLMLKIEDRYQDIFELKKDLNALSIKPEPILDVKPENMSEEMGQTAKAFESRQYDPNATVLLSSGNQGENVRNETVALNPSEALEYQKSVSHQADGVNRAIVPEEAQTIQPKPSDRKRSRSGYRGLLLAAPIAAAMLAVILVIVGIIKTVSYKHDPDNEAVTDDGSYMESQEASQDPEPAAMTVYEDSVRKFSMEYDPAVYSVNDNDDYVEFVNKDETHHIAVSFIDTDVYGGTVYDAQDYRDLADADSAVLLSSEDMDKVDFQSSGEGVNSKGWGYYTYYFSSNDDDGRLWRCSLSLFDGAGSYGCYGIYQMILDSADDADSLSDTGEAYLDTFEVTDAYETGKYDIYDLDDYGIKFATEA